MRDTTMTVWEDLVVKNGEDLVMVEHGYKKESEVRQTTVHFKVDTGAHYNLISEDILKALGLRIVGKQPVKLAGGQPGEMGRTQGLQIWWKDRYTNMDALVAPAGVNNLLSCTALELLGLKVDPVNVRLEPAFPDGILCEME